MRVEYPGGWAYRFSPLRYWTATQFGVCWWPYSVMDDFGDLRPVPRPEEVLDGR